MVRKLLINNNSSKFVQLGPQPDTGYDAKNGQASSQDDLKCDYEAPCAWKNTKPPYDTMEYVQLPPNPPPDKFNNYFHTSTVPSKSVGGFSFTIFFSIFFASQVVTLSALAHRPRPIRRIKPNGNPSLYRARETRLKSR